MVALKFLLVPRAGSSQQSMALRLRDIAPRETPLVILA
jgi:hypothetical protein